MKKIPLACELYSVHRSMAKDMEKTVKAVAAIGYEGVEFYSSIEKDAPRIKKLLDETGLKVCGWHSAWSDLSEENIDQTIAFHKAIGNKNIIVPGLPQEMTCSAEAWLKTTALFRAAQKALSAYGMRMGYHNHDAEFKPIQGEDNAWDLVAKNTPDDFIMQLDNGNAMSGGADSLALLKKYPGRAKTIHLKPYSKKDGFDTMIGDDDVPWKETYVELDRQGVTEWCIVEYESEACYEDDVEGVRVCFERLKEMGL